MSAKQYKRGPKASSSLALISVAGLFFVQPTYALTDSTVLRLFDDAVQCDRNIERFGATVPVESLYVFNTGNCEAVDPRDSEALEFYSDASCTLPVNYANTINQDYCADITDLEGLGSARGIVTDQWTLSPGSIVDVGVLPLADVTHPYMQRLKYRDVETDRGTCELEMRVFKSSPTATGDRPMIALHGGSWGSRNFAYFSLEHVIPHYVDQGYTVFTPFYRLVSPNRGSEACNNAVVEDAVADTAAALDWVMDNAERFGAEGKPVVMGQSAGGHLAASLLVDRAADIEAGVLLYPVTDIEDLLLRIQAGSYTDERGIRLVERTIRQRPAATANISASPIPEISFPNRLAASIGPKPPVFMVHGIQDGFIEPRQSARLCNAQAGRPFADVSAGPLEISDGREIRGCGADTTDPSALHLLNGSDHNFDFCIEGLSVEIDGCPSGKEAARALVQSSLQAGVNFSRLFTTAAAVESGDTDGGTDTGDSECPVADEDATGEGDTGTTTGTAGDGATGADPDCDPGTTDAGSTDGGTTDGGPTDGGTTDGGMTDGGMTGSADGATDGDTTAGQLASGGSSGGGGALGWLVMALAGFAGARARRLA